MHCFQVDFGYCISVYTGNFKEQWRLRSHQTAPMLQTPTDYPHLYLSVTMWPEIFQLENFCQGVVVLWKPNGRLDRLVLLMTWLSTHTWSTTPCSHHYLALPTCHRSTPSSSHNFHEDRSDNTLLTSQVWSPYHIKSQWEDSQRSSN